MAKPNKQNIITEIISELEKGRERVDVLATVGKSWQLSTRTFDRLWKEANEKHKAAQNEAQRLIAEQSIEATLKRHNEAIISKEKRMEILSEIALGGIPLVKPMVVNGIIEDVPVVPDWMDRKNAIAELNKMDGSYAPTNQNITIKKLGKDLENEEYAD
jgi:hypothetical protein